jgi:hypothetical protein
VTPVPDVVDGIRAEDMHPGDCVSVDQYESAVKGRLPTSFGKESSSSKYVGGTLFYDHASGRIYVQHQVSLSGPDTVRAKEAFERESALCGFSVKKYRTDNGIFTAKSYSDSLEVEQYSDRSGVGAHHQNGVAESNIGRVQRMARCMLLHLKLHWPDEFSADLWPFALDYAVHVYNHFPPRGKPINPTPMEVFCGTKVSCKILRRLRVFGCPGYILDPRLQDGKNIPKWEPRSRKGQFLGFSKDHASSVGLMRHCKTGHISPQFHIVFDEAFDTVTSERTLDLSETWIELFLNSRDDFLEGHDESADGPLPPLDDTWKSEHELSLPSGSTEEVRVDPRERTNDANAPGAQAPSRRDSTLQHDGQASPGEPDLRVDVESDIEIESAPPAILSPGPNPPPVVSTDEPELRRSKRSVGPRKKLTYDGAFKQISVLLMPVVSRTIYARPVSSDPCVIAFALADWDNSLQDPYYDYFDSIFSAQIDHESLALYDADAAFHPFAFAAKIQSADFPSYQEVIRMGTEERKKWLESMDVEISDLVEREAFEFVPRSVPRQLNEPVIKSMWAYRRKRKPDGTISRYKSRLVVRGDLQQGQFTSNETFAPVVEWSTVRMMFSLGVMRNWKTASIDFKSAFTQAQLPEPIYLELPPGYQKGNPELHDHVMKIKTSLYGDRRAANLWYAKIRQALESKAIGFTCSEFDPCLFIRSDCIICLYVDDAILHARNDATLTAVLKQIDDAGFAFSRDADFSSYLGVKVEHLADGSKKLSQPGLTQQLLEVMGMTDCNPSRTPISGPVFGYPNAEEHDDSFNYRSAIGMLMYLGNNTCPEISFAINACAQHSVNPKKPHADAVRRICRYLKGTQEEGLIIEEDPGMVALDCSVDADYAGNYTATEAEDPESVRSRCGYIISLGVVPVLWKSKRIQEICLSTMESEYISLSMSMRSLIYLRGLLFETDAIFDLELGDRLSTISTVFEDNRAAEILATTNPPRMTPRSSV